MGGSTRAAAASGRRRGRRHPARWRRPAHLEGAAVRVVACARRRVVAPDPLIIGSLWCCHLWCRHRWRIDALLGRRAEEIALSASVAWLGAAVRHRCDFGLPFAMHSILKLRRPIPGTTSPPSSLWRVRGEIFDVSGGVEPSAVRHTRRSQKARLLCLRGDSRPLIKVRALRRQSLYRQQPLADAGSSALPDEPPTAN